MPRARATKTAPEWWATRQTTRRGQPSRSNRRAPSSGWKPVSTAASAYPMSCSQAAVTSTSRSASATVTASRAALAATALVCRHRSGSAERRDAANSRAAVTPTPVTRLFMPSTLGATGRPVCPDVRIGRCVHALFNFRQLASPRPADEESPSAVFRRIVQDMSSSAVSAWGARKRLTTTARSASSQRTR